VQIHVQQDIGEFFNIFLERIQNGFGETKAMMKKLMVDDLVQEGE
jgi:hypothetical protein